MSHQKKSVVFTYGRMNPPHSGHLKLIRQIKNLANKKGKTPIVIVSHLEGTAKNPLKTNNKIKILRKILNMENLKNVEINQTTKNKLIGFTANTYSNNSDMILGQNRINQGAFIKFLPFKIHPVEGGRDMIKGPSSSKARAAVVAGNMNAFKKVTNYKNNELTKEVFNKLKAVLVPKYPTSPPKKKPGSSIKSNKNPSPPKKSTRSTRASVRSKKNSVP